LDLVENWRKTTGNMLLTARNTLKAGEVVECKRNQIGSVHEETRVQHFDAVRAGVKANIGRGRTLGERKNKAVTDEGRKTQCI